MEWTEPHSTLFQSRSSWTAVPIIVRDDTHSSELEIQNGFGNTEYSDQRPSSDWR
jgi:hypothetical protein